MITFYNIKNQISILMILSLVSLPHITYAKKNGQPKKYAIIIAGTGRCGSSCLAGILSIMGVEFGSNFPKADQYNPKGYFEDWGTGRMTRDILRDEFNVNYYKTSKIIKWDKVPHKDALKDKVKNYLKEHFDKYPIFAVKNSFLSFLIPLYAQAALELGYTPKILVPARDPHDTAHSWQSHPGSNKATLEELYTMIGNCYMSILEHATKYDTLLIYFDEMVANPRKIAHQLYEFIPGLKSYTEVKKELEEFVDVDLQHL